MKEYTNSQIAALIDEDYSYARRRDNMGGYSRGESMMHELHELMESAPDDKTRQEFQRFIQKMEQM